MSTNYGRGGNVFQVAGIGATDQGAWQYRLRRQLVGHGDGAHRRLQLGSRQAVEEH
jgi:hypothetical protein